MKNINKFSYQLSFNTYAKGNFNIYQAKNGKIYLLMGNNQTPLTYNQILALDIDVYTLIDFNIDDFKKAYEQD